MWGLGVLEIYSLCLPVLLPLSHPHGQSLGFLITLSSQTLPWSYAGLAMTLAPPSLHMALMNLLSPADDPEGPVSFHVRLSRVLVRLLYR